MFFLFFVLWLAFNGAVTVQTVILGLVISAALMLFMCRFMRYSAEAEKKLLRKSGKLLKLCYVLFVEIVKSNFALLPYIYKQSVKPDPAVVRFRADRLHSGMGQVMLANCITMTPGTITGSLKDGEFLVHCIDRSMGQGLDSSVFVDAIQEWEEK